MTLKIIDIIETSEAIIRTFGAQVFEACKEQLERGETVFLDFDGLKGVTNMFTRECVGKLYLLFGKDALLDKLYFLNVNNPLWHSSIEDAIRLATDEDYARAHEEALAFTLSNKNL